MIALIHGAIAIKTPQNVIVDVGGVGYDIITPLSTFYLLPDPPEEVRLYIHTNVREDAIQLFGFLSMLEKALFLLLTGVNGIGPKLAVNILSGIGPNELLNAISTGDIFKIQTIPGIGKKISERIILELKDKAGKLIRPDTIDKPVPVIENFIHNTEKDALSALINLGYPVKAAEQAISKAKETLTNPTLEELIRAALRPLA